MNNLRFSTHHFFLFFPYPMFNRHDGYFGSIFLRMRTTLSISANDSDQGRRHQADALGFWIFIKSLVYVILSIDANYIGRHHATFVY